MGAAVVEVVETPTEAFERLCREQCRSKGLIARDVLQITAGGLSQRLARRTGFSEEQAAALGELFDVSPDLFLLPRCGHCGQPIQPEARAS